MLSPQIMYLLQHSINLAFCSEDYCAHQVMRMCKLCKSHIQILSAELKTLTAVPVSTATQAPAQQEKQKREDRDTYQHAESACQSSAASQGCLPDAV